MLVFLKICYNKVFVAHCLAFINRGFNFLELVMLIGSVCQYVNVETFGKLIAIFTDL